MKKNGVRALVASGLAIAAMIAVSGCTASDPLINSVGNKGMTSVNGAVTEVPVDQRGEPIEFSSTLPDGTAVSSADFDGKVTVVNFWYAACAPCRVEAPFLQEVYAEHEADVAFLGVNVRDQAPQAEVFEESFGITYPSVMDLDGTVQMAFTGQFSPNAVPTTIILDQQGRVAARILGQLSDKSILDTLVTELSAAA